jgi:hypothetical protein
MNVVVRATSKKSRLDTRGMHSLLANALGCFRMLVDRRSLGDGFMLCWNWKLLWTEEIASDSWFRV